MYDKLWLIPFFPLLGSIVNGLLGKKIKNEKVIGAIGTLAIASSFVVACSYFFQLLGEPITNKVHQDIIGSWISVGHLHVSWGFLLDPLSALMIMIVTGVGSLIHLYSIGYMHGEEGFYRYFSYLNLFCFSMLMLVLGNNALVMFIGWEGVGLCSYLLIGYYFHKKSAGDAAKKAFVVNRVGDFAFLIGMFTLFWTMGTQHNVWTLNFVKIAQTGHLLGNGSLAVTIITLCFFIGATGKSAQIPLYTWLPDAMEGPTPVSALIHAATMVTAGVYMIGRMNGLFAMAPKTMAVIAIIGAATALFAASIGMAQNDIKRVLAYSTVSQLGYMFLAMGVGAFGAGIFHLMTHAFFKACLFLCSGSVIHALSGEQDMRYMGGLRKHMPITFYTYLSASIAIAGLPFFSAFFSKDEILWWAYASDRGNFWLWLVGAVAAGMTAFYIFRSVFMTFFGEERITEHARHHLHESPWVMTIPLIVLGTLAFIGGYVGVPEILGGTNPIEHYFDPVFARTQEMYNIHLQASMAHATGLQYGLMTISVALAVFGLFVAWIMYVRNPELATRFAESFPGLLRTVYNKWYVDEIYDALFVNPTKRLGYFLWRGFDVVVVDGIVNGVAWTVKGCSRALRFTQSGLVHNYAMTMVIGVVVIVAVYVLR